MENEFKYDNNYIEDAIICCKQAAIHISELELRLKKIDILDLDIINYHSGNTYENIKLFNNIFAIETDINKIKNEAFAVMLTMDGFQYQFPTWVDEGRISPSDLFSLAGVYMRNIIKTNLNIIKVIKWLKLWKVDYMRLGFQINL